MHGSVSSSEEEQPEPDCNGWTHTELFAVNPFKIPQFSELKTRYMAAFDVEKWATQLGELTFATATEAVTWQEGVSLQHHYQQGCCGIPDKVTPEDDKQLENLRHKIGALAVQIGGGDFFVRLGPRSPKDAPAMVSPPYGVSEAQISAALAGAAERLRSGQLPVHACPHKSLHCFQQACGELLRVTSADEAISLLVSSARVMGDVSHTLDHGTDEWNMSVVVRGWRNGVTLDREFRVFIVSGQATAISQYDERLSYDFVREQPNAIAIAILRGVEQLRPALGRLGLAKEGSAVVADFAVLQEGERGEFDVKVIELNPFGPVTGARGYTM